MSEAGVAVKFGLTLGAFYRALQPPTEKALAQRERDTHTGTVNTAVSPLVCEGSLQDVNH